MLSSVKPVCCPGLLLLILFLTFTGCSKEALKPSEDSIQIRSILAYVDRLKQTYEAKDQPGLLALISPIPLIYRCRRFLSVIFNRSIRSN
jgi:hypothetical protein